MGVKDSRKYYAYLLRFWQENADDEVGREGWRFSLEDPRTRARHGFSDFESLLAFLRTQFEGASNMIRPISPGDRPYFSNGQAVLPIAGL